MKLFNKKRFQLFKGNRFQKYIAYAIGEIILVIFGILIALGINNWRQNRVLTNANVELQNKVLIQLDKDIASLESFKEELSVLNETYLSVLGREYDASKVNLSKVVSTVLFEVNTLMFDQHVPNLIDNTQLNNSDASLELIQINSTYKIYEKNIKDIESIIYAKMTKNLEEIEKTQPWYTALMTDFKCGNACINYLRNDEDHKSRIASLRFLYIEAYGQRIDGFRNDLMRSKKDLLNSMKATKN
jgi:hypothetical protein